MTRVCFVSLYSYPLFNPDNHTIFGGSEVRAKLFAEALSSNDELEISFVVFDHGQASRESFNRISVWKHPSYRLSPARTLTSKICNFFSKGKSIYSEINADVYCVFGASDFGAEVSEWCRTHNKIFVLFAASDLDFSADYYPGSPVRNVYGSVGATCYQVMKNSDAVIVQTNHQARLLRERFGKEGLLVRNPIVIDRSKEICAFEQRSNQVVWIGKSDTVKRPEIFLELASIVHEAEFTMVLNRSDDRIHENIVARKLPNLNIVERLSNKEIQRLFSKAKAFVNTSSAEGFANTFLEAAVHGVPIFTFSFDPDGFIEKNECGFNSHENIEALAARLRSSLMDKRQFSIYSQNAQNYVRANHELNQRAKELYAALIRLENQKKPNLKELSL